MSEKQVAIVTGSTSGIGVTVAEKLVAQGLSVLITGRSEQRGNALASRLGDAASFFSCDLRDDGAASRLVEEAVSRFGRLDVVVNNAGIDHTEDLLKVESEDVARIFRLNAFAPITLAIAGARQMREQGQGGSLINITSRLATIGVPTMALYSASKGALLAFTTAAAVELAQYNIRVNAVAPGLTRTPLFEEWISSLEDSEGEAVKLAEAIPLGRFAETSDVAAVVAFLASPDASYLTGVSIPVEGGYLAK